MGNFLLSLLLIALIFICFVEAEKWRALTLILIVAITSVVHFLFDNSSFVLAGVAMLVLPWSTLKELPDRRLLYFSMLAIVFTGNGAHFAWIYLQKDTGDFAEGFLRGALFLIVLAGSILLFNLAAIILRARYKKRSQS